MDELAPTGSDEARDTVTVVSRPGSEATISRGPRIAVEAVLGVALGAGVGVAIFGNERNDILAVLLLSIAVPTGVTLFAPTRDGTGAVVGLAGTL